MLKSFTGFIRYSLESLNPRFLEPCMAKCGRGSGDRSLKAGGKSGLHRARWSLTATGGDPRESATENIPPRVSRGKGEKAR